MSRNWKIALVVTLTGVIAAAAYLRSSAPAPAAAPDERGPPRETSASPSPGAAVPGAATGATGEDFAPLFAARLAALAAQSALVAIATNDVVRFDLDAIRIDTKVEHDQPTDGKRGIGIAVGATFPDGDGAFRFISGAVGVGRTRGEAIDQAVGGWLGLTGKALLEAVPRRAVSKSAIPLGPMAAFPGSIAVRGTADLHWSPRRDAELLDAVVPALRGLSPESSHSVALSIVGLGGGALDGQCLIDHGAAEDLCQLALKFDWPGSAEGYLARQVYVVRPRTNMPTAR